MIASIPRTLYSSDHEEFRDLARAFVDRHIVPHAENWESEHAIPRSFWREAGDAGLLGLIAPEEYGGGGADDLRYPLVLNEELARCGHASLAVALSVHNDLAMPYILKLGTDEQKQRWIPGACDGSSILAVAMTEPGTGTDLAAITTTAIDQGDHYLLNGSKTFISNGYFADVVVVAAKSDPSERARGMSLLVVESGMAGFDKGRKLEKVGLHAQDTSELFFTGVRVPKENLLGEEGQGFAYLNRFLARERAATAFGAVSHAENYLAWTLHYVTQRKAFGQTIGSFQNSKFVLAELATEVQAARVFVDRCAELLLADALTSEHAAMAKWWCTELRLKVVDRCLQLHGGYGYMMEYAIARAYIDSRVETIYAGTTEIMKEIIGRGLGL